MARCSRIKFGRAPPIYDTTSVDACFHSTQLAALGQYPPLEMRPPPRPDATVREGARALAAVSLTEAHLGFI